MRDQRVAHFRSTFNALTESLDATVRVSRWSGPDPIPDPLERSAAKLVECLGAASRLSAGNLVGAPDVVAKLSRIRGAIHRLDTAYVEYRRILGGDAPDLAQAAATLDWEICGARSDADGG